MRARVVALGLVALVATAGLAGCFGEKSSPVTVVPYVDLVDATPGRPLQVAFLLTSTYTFRQRLGVAVEAPEGWDARPEVAEVDIPGRATMPLVVNLTPTVGARLGAQEVGVRVGETRGRVLLALREAGASPVAASGAEVALVYVAWHPNGTLAATNDPAFRNGTSLPQGDAPAWDAPGNATFAPWRLTLGSGESEPLETRLVDLAARAGDALVAELPGGLRGLVRVVAVEAPPEAP